MTLKELIFLALVPVALTSCKNEDKEQLVQCYGNIETSANKIIKAGVVYKLRYSITDANAQINFAGREFTARAEKGNTHKGYWIKLINNDNYFSFLPEEGGTIKFQFEPNVWFSGSC